MISHLWSSLCLQDDQSPRVDKFGIVAAMSKNGVIGLDGGIPWRVPQDRKIFKNLTDNGIMIIGKRTFEEHPTLAHINHTRCCIVVSRSMKTIESNPEYSPNTALKLARSLPEALVMAGEFEEMFLLDGDNISSSKKQSEITCWIAGGQQLYEEAFNHDSAAELHLSVVDIEIDYSSRDHESVALFPPIYLWTDRFELKSKTFYSQDGDAPSFNYHIYRRKH
jgi:dihydrofolate reductase